MYGAACGGCVLGTGIQDIWDYPTHVEGVAVDWRVLRPLRAAAEFRKGQESVNTIGRIRNIINRMHILTYGVI